MTDTFIPSSNLSDQFEMILCELFRLESGFRSFESSIEFELLMIALSEIKTALETLFQCNCEIDL